MEKQFVETLKRAEHALITFRRDWSVDALASALAIQRYLASKGKRAEIVADDFTPAKSAKFLPGANEVKPSFERLQKFIINLDVSKTKIEELSYDLKDDKLRIYINPKAGQFAAADLTTATSDFKYDLIIAVDTPDYHSLGALFDLNTDFFYHRPTVNIDHDPANEHYGNLNAVDIAATSTSEVIYSLLKSAGEHFLDPDTATCLLAGMISKTRSFKTPTVTPRTLEIAAELVAAGARRDEIVQNLYRTRSLATLKLWGRALARLKYDGAARFAWTLLVRPDFVHAGAGEEFLPDVIEELMMNSPEAEIFGVLYEQDAPADKSRPAGICALVSSEKYSNALGLVSSLKPEGTRRLARLCFPAANLIDAEKAVLGSIYKSLGKSLPADAITVPAGQPATQQAQAIGPSVA
ncbi:MAG: DHH family phosphoesterase [Patescibacteria group bacterium]